MIKRRTSHTGLSLIEMLVVLVLISMVSALVLQAVTFSYANYYRLSDKFTSQHLSLIPESWFRKSISRLAASSNPAFFVTGNPSSVSGYSYSKILGSQGYLTQVTWALDRTRNGYYLSVNEGETRNGAPNTGFEVMSWEATNVQFKYLDEGGSWYSSWPAIEIHTGLLPEAVVLEITHADSTSSEVYVAIEQRKRGLTDYRDLL